MVVARGDRAGQRGAGFYAPRWRTLCCNWGGKAVSARPRVIVESLSLARCRTVNLSVKDFTMNKLFAALLAGFFAVSSFAQAP
ncbi:MAG: hypothetical protein LWW82_02580, partial [Comamonadaceae bacterium]|nr:hypothetical protein [Comamonadaceae bacterium]